MKKDGSSKDKKNAKKKDPDTESIVMVDEMVHCDEDITVLKLEFTLVC